MAVQSRMNISLDEIDFCDLGDCELKIEIRSFPSNLPP